MQTPKKKPSGGLDDGDADGWLGGEGDLLDEDMPDVFSDL